MDKKSPLFQLMDLRMNGVMNDITAQDEAYQSLMSFNAARQSLFIMTLLLTDASISMFTFLSKSTEHMILSCLLSAFLMFHLRFFALGQKNNT